MFGIISQLPLLAHIRWKGQLLDGWIDIRHCATILLVKCEISTKVCISDFHLLVFQNYEIRLGTYNILEPYFALISALTIRMFSTEHTARALLATTSGLSVFVNLRMYMYNNISIGMTILSQCWIEEDPQDAKQASATSLPVWKKYKCVWAQVASYPKTQDVIHSHMFGMKGMKK